MLVFEHEVVARFTGKCRQAREAGFRARTSLASGGDGDSFMVTHDETRHWNFLFFFVFRVLLS